MDHFNYIIENNHEKKCSQYCSRIQTALSFIFEGINTKKRNLHLTQRAKYNEFLQGIRLFREIIL